MGGSRGPATRITASLAALALLVGTGVLGLGQAPARAARLPAGGPSAAATATATATAGADIGDYGVGQAMPHNHLVGPYAWTWHAAFPGARVILYYGIVGSPQGGVIGYYGGNEDGLLSQLRQQGQAYATLDPSHPVVEGLDIADPLADALPQQGYWIDRMDPDTVQHYVDLTRANHMVFFMDMQIGFSTVQRELAYLWPYLQLPWVNLGMDPEWDHAYNGQGDGCPGFVDNIDATGRMRASEINYVMQQLSALVIANHLPPKILLVHQYQFGENPNYPGDCGQTLPSEGWQHIKLLPGVQLVINTDGVGCAACGGPPAKAADYDVFDHDQHIQYAGIKLYQYYPILTPNFYDEPQMTPSDVLNLDPPPNLVMYQ
ncbi:MAG TPA: hypothetical protein VIC85_05695 [Ktedonobacterales bacterium]|jgi:hypothetical protein